MKEPSKTQKALTFLAIAFFILLGSAVDRRRWPARPTARRGVHRDLGMKFVVVEIKHRTGFGTQWEESKPVAIFDTEKAANEWACNTATIEDYVVFDVPDFGC